MSILAAIDRRDMLDAFEQAYRFDDLNTPAVLNQLTRTALRIWQTLQSIETWSYRERPGATPLIQPGQDWLAEHVGVTRQCANECVAQLYRLGLIEKITRRRRKGLYDETGAPLGGRYQTCLYWLRAPVDWLHQRYVNAVNIMRRANARAEYTKRKREEIAQRAADQADADKRRRIEAWRESGGPLGEEGRRVMYGGLIREGNLSSLKIAVRVPGDAGKEP